MTRKDRLFVLAVLVVFFARLSYGAQILAFFPFPGKSHHAVFQVILAELGNNGHQIDYYSPFPMSPSHPNVKHYQVKDITKDLVAGLGGDIKDENSSIFRKIHYLMVMRNVTLSETCRMDEVQTLIKSKNEYDLVLHEAYFIQEFASVLPHRFKAPGVVLMSAGDFSAANELSGLPDNPAYMVEYMNLLGDRMTFFERVYNTIATRLNVGAMYLDLYRTQTKVDECFQYPGWETRPHLPRLASDVALVLVNSHHSIGFSYPKAPHVKEIGGVNIVQNKPLPKDLESFMNEASHGVIYFSLGTVFDMSTMLGPEYKHIFANAFSRVKEKVLWKWNGEPWAGLPSNVKLSKWFPQRDILAHKNVKLFITHGGLLSSYETIHNGVPTIITPLFADQAKNAQRMKEAGFGEPISISELTEELLYKTMRKVIDDTKYKNEVMRRSQILQDRPMKPLEEAVYWIEYVLKHGRVLQPFSVHLSFIQLHLLDVYAFITGFLFLVYYLARKALAFVRSMTSFKKHSPINKKKKA